MSWGGRDPQNLPGQAAEPGRGREGHPLLRLREGGEGKREGAGPGLPQLWGLCLFPSLPSAGSGGVEGPGGSFWGFEVG